MLTGNASSVVSATNLEANNEPIKNIEDSNYEIYPLPQSQVYLDNYITITDEVNLVVDSTIDEWTKEFVHEILKSKSIEAKVSNNIVNDKTNIIIGTNGSGEFVDTYVNEHIVYDSKIYDKEDGYLLRIDEKLGDKGTIAILGEDTDSSY
ncbi:glycoside hydrolase family 20 zincin-like fold domain-containing protein, partial [Clostridium sp.]|uniref:glycoside hydrolase family 20 zincin-like fold domain-containing protein n=1 Tax=Clostridium sp. TaxID=1506 RepID=UPI003F66228D